MGMTFLPPGVSSADYTRWTQATPEGRAYAGRVSGSAYGGLGPSHAPPPDQLAAFMQPPPQPAPQPMPQPQMPAPQQGNYYQNTQQSYYGAPQTKATNFGYSMPQYQPRKSSNPAYRSAAWGNAANFNRNQQANYGQFYSQAQRADAGNRMANQQFGMQSRANSQKQRDQMLRFGVNALTGLMG